MPARPQPATHPWKAARNKHLALKDAKHTHAVAESRRRYSEGREYFVELQRSKRRAAAGIPLELPKMKAWDFKKGRVK